MIIELKNINKSYGPHTVLKDFNLSVEKGDFISIVGRSGAGKSTLLNIIGMLEEADSGELTICGIKNPEFGSGSGRKLLQNSIGYLFQNYGLIENETVMYNLRIASKFKGMSKKDEKEAFIKALGKVGLENVLNKKVFQLSGGEQQRISIAKLLIKSPDIILADEPTGSLDAGNRDKILKLLREMNADGKTILLVTHDEEVKRCAKRSIAL